VCHDPTRRADKHVSNIGVVWEAVGSELITMRGVSCDVGVVSRPHESMPVATKPFSRHSQLCPTTQVQKKLDESLAYALGIM
jgi:hypothetical protein